MRDSQPAFHQAANDEQQSARVIELTAEQQAEIRRLTGQQVQTVALQPEALEARVAPGTFLN